jgi:hypothetical protein
MQFELSDALKEQMQEREVENIIISSKVRSCWSGAYAEVSARFSKNPGDQSFEEYEADGYHIYVQPNIPFSKTTVALDYEKMLFYERIIIYGVREY